MNTDEYQEESTNLSNIGTDLYSTVQGHITAITKLLRSKERANHYIELLTTALDKKRPTRGLIPKIIPKIPDTPSSFIMK